MVASPGAQRRSHLVVAARLPVKFGLGADHALVDDYRGPLSLAPIATRQDLPIVDPSWGNSGGYWKLGRSVGASRAEHMRVAASELWSGSISTRIETYIGAAVKERGDRAAIDHGSKLRRIDRARAEGVAQGAGLDAGSSYEGRAQDDLPRRRLARSDLA